MKECKEHHKSLGKKRSRKGWWQFRKSKNNSWLMLNMNMMKLAVKPKLLLANYHPYVSHQKFKKLWLKHKFMTASFIFQTLRLLNKSSILIEIPYLIVISSYSWFYSTTLINPMFMYLRAELDPDSEFFS